MICLLCVGQRLDGAAVHFIVLPQARRGNGRAGVSRTAILVAADQYALATARCCNACDDASYVAARFR
jgi:hypothetical protein